MKKAAEILFLITILIAVLKVGYGVKTGEKAERLFYENRKTEEFPQFSRESIFDGSFAEGLDKAFSDAFPHRDDVLKLKAYIDGEILKKPIVNDVIYQGEGEPMLPRLTPKALDLEELKTECAEMTEDIGELSEAIKANGGEFYFVGVPEQYSYFRSKYPDYIFNNDEILTAQEELFYGGLEEHGVNYVNMNDVFTGLGRSEDYYSFVDHHFSFYGAYETYKAVITAVNSSSGLNLHILGDEDLGFKEAPNPYFGSRNRKLMGLYNIDERLVVPEYKNRTPFLRTDNGEVMDSLLYVYYMDESLPVTYSAYMGGDVAETVFETHREDLPNLLIFGDSFTNPIETLIYTDFNETRCVDLRYYTEKNIWEYIEDYKTDVVVLVRDDTRFLEFTGNGDLKKPGSEDYDIYKYINLPKN